MTLPRWLVYFVDHEAVSIEAACAASARRAAEALRPGLTIRRIEPRHR